MLGQQPSAHEGTPSDNQICAACPNPDHQQDTRFDPDMALILRMEQSRKLWVLFCMLVRSAKS
eukprot:4740637-Amphidinium_carterae.1